MPAVFPAGIKTYTAYADKYQQIVQNATVPAASPLTVTLSPYAILKREDNTKNGNAATVGITRAATTLVEVHPYTPNVTTLTADQYGIDYALSTVYFGTGSAGLAVVITYKARGDLVAAVGGINTFQEEINAIEAELGTNPSSQHGTVGDRLSNIMVATRTFATARGGGTLSWNIGSNNRFKWTSSIYISTKPGAVSGGGDNRLEIVMPTSGVLDGAGTPAERASVDGIQLVSPAEVLFYKHAYGTGPLAGTWRVVSVANTTLLDQYLYDDESYIIAQLAGSNLRTVMGDKLGPGETVTSDGTVFDATKRITPHTIDETLLAAATRGNNLITNASFEAVAIDPPHQTTVAGTVARVTSPTFHGQYSLKWTATGAASEVFFRSVPVVAGRNYVFSGYLLPGVDRTIAVYINYRDSGGVSLANTAGNNAVTTGKWNRISHTAVAPTNAVTAEFSFYNSAGVANEIIYIDSLQHEVGTVPSPFAVKPGEARIEVVSNPAQEQFIDGLEMQWDALNGITAKAGAAFIPGLNRIYNVPTAISLTGMALPSINSWYHVYLYDNAGTPALEYLLSATADDPASYKGRAHQKGTVNTRRYLGSIKSTGNTNQLHRFSCDEDWMTWITKFGIITGGAATVNTVISCTSGIPLPSREGLFDFYNAADTAGTVYLGHGDETVALVTANCFGQCGGKAANSAGAIAQVRGATNAAREIKYRASSASENLYAWVSGYRLVR